VKLQCPIISNLAHEVWKTKETKLKKDENPKLGDEKKRSILMEAITAMTLLIAGTDIVIMRHPDSIALIKDMIKELTA
jgi:acetyl-CoA decarbonylase/synthase complex subunit delta